MRAIQCAIIFQNWTTFTNFRPPPPLDSHPCMCVHNQKCVNQKNTSLSKAQIRTDPHKEQRGELDSWYCGNGIMVWMGVSLKHGFHLHIFPPRNSEGQKLTVTGEIFDQAMKKPRGFLQYLKRHPAATIAMDNYPAHNKARATGISVIQEFPFFPGKISKPESDRKFVVCDGHRQKSSSTPKSTATGSRY